MTREPIYSQDWISPYFPLWSRLLRQHPDQRILEIGCFEGRATTWFLQNFPASCITCIDTFEGGQDHKELGLDFSGVRQRFEHNIHPWKDRVDLRIGHSSGVLHRVTPYFDVALIDGSHLAHDVLSDAVLTWPFMKSGGVVIFDDYGWNGGRPPEQTPAPAIDSFLICYAGHYELLEKGYQVLVRKL